MNQCQHQSLCSRHTGLFFLSGAQLKGDHGIDSYAESNPQGIRQILDRVHQRKSRHGIFADPGHKKAVYDIIQGIHQHRNHHRQGHGDNQRDHRLFFHKGFVHYFNSLKVC